MLMIDALGGYHPLIIEGMGGYDPRDPEPIASRIVSHLRARWQAHSPTKPVILVTQDRVHTFKFVDKTLFLETFLLSLS